MAALARALTLACPQGYVRVFTDEGPPMAALLHQLVATQRSSQDARESRSAAWPGSCDPLAQSTPGRIADAAPPRCQAWPRR